MIRNMGIEIDYGIKKHGLFPDLIGEVHYKIKTQTNMLKPLDLVERGKLICCDVYVTTTEKTHDIYKDQFKTQFEGLYHDTFPGELKFHDEECPISKPRCKAEVLAITAVFKFEQPTCLQANILLDRCNESKAETVAKELIEQLLPLYENKVISMDEHHAD